MLGIQGICETSASSRPSASHPCALLVVLPLQLRQLPDVEGSDHEAKEEGEEHQGGHFRSEEHSAKLYQE